MGSVDLPIIAAIPFEDVPQEHQLGLKAVFITEISGRMHHSTDWCVWGALHFVAQRAIRSAGNV
jgi:hypothetical protein